MSFDLSPLDRRILNLLQKEFPISERPYLTMADQLEIEEKELIDQVALMKEAGIIRRIGAILESRAIGYYSTLCACRVEEHRTDDVAAIINQQAGVTHNYLRDQEYNLWFTLTSETEVKARIIIDELEAKTGLKILSMPTDRVYKIRVALDMGENNAI